MTEVLQEPKGEIEGRTLSPAYQVEDAALYARRQAIQALELLAEECLSAERTTLVRQVLGIGCEPQSLDQLASLSGQTRGEVIWTLNKAAASLLEAAQNYGIANAAVLGLIETLLESEVAISEPTEKEIADGSDDLPEDLLEKVRNKKSIEVKPRKRQAAKRKLGGAAVTETSRELTMRDVRALWQEGELITLNRMPVTGFWTMDVNDPMIAKDLAQVIGRQPTDDELDDYREEWYRLRPGVRPQTMPRFGEEMLGADF